MTPTRLLRIGLVSDTHGLMRPQALDALRGCAHIIHAGDIGSEQILRELAALAPLTAVRGNNDREPWARAVPEAAVVELEPIRIGVVHEIAHRSRHPQLAGIQVLVHGHSHRPRVETCAGVLHVNPGSAGPRRFSLPVTVAHLELRHGRVDARIEHLTV